VTDYAKDPSDTIDYSMSWHQIGSDSITSSSWTSETLTIGLSSWNGLVTTCFVSGGSDGEVAELTNTIVTGMGRTLQRTISVKVEEL
jgi:hypothetical protein